MHTCSCRSESIYDEVRMMSEINFHSFRSKTPVLELEAAKCYRLYLADIYSQ